MSNVVEMGKKYNLYSWSAQRKVNPANIVKAEGIYFWDEDGKKYYDMSAQLVNMNLGHGNKKLIQAIKDQADKLPFLAPSFSCDVRTEAARKIVEISGLEGAKVFFTNAGAEANENAIKLAKAYTGKWKVFSMYRSYHGATYGAANLTGEPRRFINEPGIPGFIKFDGPYPYRAPKACKFDSEEDVTAFYLELLENQILYEGPDLIAAIFLETVVGSNGVLIPPKGYLEGVRALCDKYGICMVCDEVMAGFGRTGKWFAFQNWDVKPDLITFAKGSTCGYVPLGGVVVSKKIAEFYDDNKMFCGLTYSAHPMGCAVAIAAIDAYRDDKVFDNVLKVGKVLGEGLEALKAKHACVGDVRYIGLFSIVEFVKDKATREPIVPFGKDPEGIMPKILGMLKAEGFYTYAHENMIHVSPPLIITEQEMKEALQMLDKVMDSIDNMIK
ncbi:MAG: aminotransferase class III-fold pyridoxal phosphate-dependent enzyme [Clostridiales bacterium]|jgi:taurine--2-oxoglutarate transaminase|nr:aminotransferase class III-fold pyridoxal phosphate-dependent enzyme [Clostridiales bacterium]